MTLFPNCKINLGLNIVEKRTDGYHNIETIFYPIPLCDELIIEMAQTDTLDMEGIPVECDMEKNLVYKVLTLLRAQGYHIPPTYMRLKKNIPNGAGLGGGSSDAAFAMKGVNTLYNLGLSDQQMEKYLSGLGADCPVFVQNKPVYATGIGNIFSDIHISLAGLHLVLVKPNEHIPTKDAYASVHPAYPEIRLKDIIQRPIETWKELMGNDFEQSIFPKHPLIEQTKEQLYEMGAVYASMSGSGSSVYGLFRKGISTEGLFEDMFTYQCPL